MIGIWKNELKMIEPVFEKMLKPLVAVCGFCGLKVPIIDDFFWQAEGLASMFDAEGGSSAHGSKFYGQNYLWTGDSSVREKTQICDACVEKMLVGGMIMPVGTYLE